MPAPETVIPRMEAILGSVAGGTEDVALWLRLAKQIMLSASNKDQTDWEFALSSDIDETGNDLETGATLYGMVIGTNAADAELDWVQVSDDGDGTLTFDGTAALVNDVKVAHYLPAAATDGTEELHPYLYPEGISFTNHMTVCADGQDGTNPATDDIRGWFLYRTAAS